MHKIIPTLLLPILLLSIHTVVAQKTAHPGIDLYLKDKNSEALTSLNFAVKQKEFEANGEIWNFLGLANIKAKNYKDSRKALEKAVKLTPNNATYQSNLAYVYMLLGQTGKARSSAKKSIEIDPKNVMAYYIRGSANVRDAKLDDAEKDADQMVLIDPTYQQGYVLKSQTLVAELGQRLGKGSDVKDHLDLLKTAMDDLKTGREKCKDTFHNLIDEEEASVEPFYKFFSKNKTASTALISDPEPGVTPLKILVKPHPSYTDSARQGNVQGTIVLAVLFGTNKKVEYIMPMKRLGNGLDEEAINAARRISFEPVTKDGKPVPVVKMIEYTFSIY